MKIRRLRWTVPAACIVTLLAVTLAWAGIQPDPFRTGLFGVTAGQSIRISVLNAGEASGGITPCIRVWDAAGTLLYETDGGPLPGGRGTFVDFLPIPDDGTRTRSDRIQVRK